MSDDSPRPALFRRVLSRLRVRTGGFVRFGFRLFAMFDYAWHLVIWSRIAAGEMRRKPVELPRSLLDSKKLRYPAPSLGISGIAEAKAFEEGFSDIYALLFSNLEMPGLLSSYRHVRPGPAFRGIYLWDTAFIAQVWRDWDPAVGMDALRAVLEVRDGDRLQHVVANFVQSPYTQPPLIGWSAVRLARELAPHERRAFFEEVYPVVANYHAWLNKHRRHSSGLYFWEHPYESGVENAPRFSNSDESVLSDTRTMAAPDFASYVVLQLEALAEMAAALGKTTDHSRWIADAETLRRLINERLWHARDGLYYDAAFQSGDHVRCHTVASLMPLWAGVPDEDRLQRLLAWLERADGFGTPMPVPSVAPCDPAYEKDMWRGPVWLNAAYGVVCGLLRYDRGALAGRLAYRLCQYVYLVFHTERRVYEFYDPEMLHTRELRRKKGNLFKSITLGTRPQTAFVGWSGLANCLMIEVLFGLQRTAAGFTLTPRFPPAAEGATWRLDLPVNNLTIALTCSPDGLRSGHVRHNSSHTTFRLHPGESLAIPAPVPTTAPPIHQC